MAIKLEFGGDSQPGRGFVNGSGRRCVGVMDCTPEDVWVVYGVMNDK